MQVISLIRRPAGHRVVLNGVAYAFQPPDYLAEVTDERHLARFREIPEGYRLVGTPELALEAPQPAPRSRTRTRRFAPIDVASLDGNLANFDDLGA